MNDKLKKVLTWGGIVVAGFAAAYEAFDNDKKLKEYEQLKEDVAKLKELNDK